MSVSVAAGTPHCSPLQVPRRIFRVGQVGQEQIGFAGLHGLLIMVPCEGENQV